MIVLYHLSATGVAVIVGFCLLSLLNWPGIGARPLHERIALGYLIGIMLIGVETLVLGYVRIPATLATLLLLQLVPAALFAIRFFRSKDRSFFHADLSCRALIQHRWWQWALIVLIASKLIYVFTMNLTELRRSDDAFVWVLSLAKATYYSHNHAAHPIVATYSKIPGLILHWFAVWHSPWNEFSLNLPHFNYYLALLLLTYANLRARVNKTASLIGVYLLSSFPILLAHAVMAGYGDLPMAIYLCFCGVYAYRYACQGRADDLILAGFFTVCLPATKPEGLFPFLFIGLYGMFIALAWRRQWLRPAAIWGVTGGLAGLVIAGIILVTLVFGETGPPLLPTRVWRSIAPGNHLAEIGRPLLEHFGSFFNNWMIVGTLAAFAIGPMTVIFSKRPELTIGLFGLTLLGCYVYLFCIGGAYEWLILGTTVNRTYLQIIPVILFAVVVMTALKCEKKA